MVPINLQRWFVIHFVVDMVFAVPLLFIPAQFLTFLAWEPIDPLMSRLVGAALMGIGFGGFINRNAGIGGYVVMLNMKIIWSFSAIFAILVSMLSGGPIIGWLILILFVIFAGVWIRYRVHITQSMK